LFITRIVFPCAVLHIS
jgi:hypothetical protein